MIPCFIDWFMPSLNAAESIPQGARRKEDTICRRSKEVPKIDLNRCRPRHTLPCNPQSREISMTQGRSKIPDEICEGSGAPSSLSKMWRWSFDRQDHLSPANSHPDFSYSFRSTLSCCHTGHQPNSCISIGIEGEIVTMDACLDCCGLRSFFQGGRRSVCSHAKSPSPLAHDGPLDRRGRLTPLCRTPRSPASFMTIHIARSMGLTDRAFNESHRRSPIRKSYAERGR